MQEEPGDDFDGDRARVVWSLGPEPEGDRSTTAPPPWKGTSASQVELQLIADLSADDGVVEGHDTLEARPVVRSLPSSRPNQREVPRSFAHSAKTRTPAKKKHHAGLRTLVGVGAPAKHADAKSMAALLKGVTPASKLPQQLSDKTVDNMTAARSPIIGLGARKGVTVAANTTPVAGLQHDASPHAAPAKAAPRSQLRSLNTPPTGMTMAKLLSKRPLPTPGKLPSTPAAAMPITPCPKAFTPAMTPHTRQIECSTPLDALNHKGLASAITPSLSASTPVLVPDSKHRNPSRTPASLLQSSRSSSGKKDVHQGFRKLPGVAVAQPAVHSVGGALPQCPLAAPDHRQRTHADLLAGVPRQVCHPAPTPSKRASLCAWSPCAHGPLQQHSRQRHCRLHTVQDKPSSVFTPMAPKPKRRKDKAGGMQQKLEDELVRASLSMLRQCVCHTSAILTRSEPLQQPSCSAIRAVQ